MEPRLQGRPRIAIVLGSGLGHLVDSLDSQVGVPFTELLGFPASGVQGHAGRFVSGTLEGVPVLLQAGRYHAYEGHRMELVVAPVRVMAALGVEVLIVTNAAGGVDPAREPGDLMLIDDHLNLMGRNPLIGPVHPGEVRFPDMSAPYDLALQEIAMDAAVRLRIRLARGTYAAVLGPSYETAAEVRMIGQLGAHAVGMSTVPEVITARAAGIRCVGFSMITNKGTGLSLEPIGHEEVIEVGRRAGGDLGRLIASVVAEIAAGPQSVGAK